MDTGGGIMNTIPAELNAIAGQLQNYDAPRTNLAIGLRLQIDLRNPTVDKHASQRIDR